MADNRTSFEEFSLFEGDLTNRVFHYLGVRERDEHWWRIKTGRSFHPRIIKLADLPEPTKKLLELVKPFLSGGHE